MSHYFTNDPLLKKETFYYDVTIGDIKLKLSSGSGIFSKRGLDKGTEVLLKNLPSLNEADKIIDVGCGNGVIGLYLAKLLKTHVTMVDVNRNALKVSLDNANVNNISNINVIESSFFENIKGTFDLIISNPPIRIGKEKLFSFYSESYQRLNKEGLLLVVVKKSQGAPSHEKKIGEIFGNIHTKKEKGYYIIWAYK